ncbi:MAG: anthranilate phosphoribosyltransferase, partial [Gemmatimonadota bacterium]
IEMPPAAMAQVLAEAGVVFMYAPLMHPALRHVGPVRRELGIPTVMNMVGPLANPARAGRQVVGVAEAARVPLLAEALLALGSVHALVVHGAPGMDEISPLGPTTVMEVRDGALRAWEIDPGAHGLGAVDPAELAGETPAHNAQIVEAVLAGQGTAGAHAAVLLNAAAAVYVAGHAESYAAAVPLVRAALRGGVGSQALARLRAATQRVAPPSLP